MQKDYYANLVGEFSVTTVSNHAIAAIEMLVKIAFVNVISVKSFCAVSV